MLLVHTLSPEGGLLTHHHGKRERVVGDGDGDARDVPGGVSAPLEERRKGPPPCSSSLASGGREGSPVDWISLFSVSCFRYFSESDHRFLNSRRSVTPIGLKF